MAHRQASRQAYEDVPKHCEGCLSVSPCVRTRGEVFVRGADPNGLLSLQHRTCTKSLVSHYVVMHCSWHRKQVNYFRLGWFRSGAHEVIPRFAVSIGVSPCALRGGTQARSISRSMVENRSKLMSAGRIIDRPHITET